MILQLEKFLFFKPSSLEPDWIQVFCYVRKYGIRSYSWAPFFITYPVHKIKGTKESFQGYKLIINQLLKADQDWLFLWSSPCNEKLEWKLMVFEHQHHIFRNYKYHGVDINHCAMDRKEVHQNRPTIYKLYDDWNEKQETIGPIV